MTPPPATPTVVTPNPPAVPAAVTGVPDVDRLLAAMADGLCVEGELRVEVNGIAAEVSAAGRTVTVSALYPLRFATAASNGHGGGLANARRMAAALNALGLTLRVERRGVALLTLGRAARPDWLGRLLGSPHIAYGRRGVG